MPETANFSNLPRELADLVWTASIGSDIPTILDRRALPNVSELSGALFSNRGFAGSVSGYRRPGSKFCFSTDIFPFLGFHSCTTNHTVLTDGHKDTNFGVRTERFKGSGMNTATVLIFPQGREICRIAPGIPSYLREWCKKDKDILSDINAVITLPSITYQTSSRPVPEHKFSSASFLCAQNEISHLVNDLYVERGVNVTVHSTFKGYQASSILPSRCVWHGVMTQGGPIVQKTTLLSDVPLDHRFHLSLPRPPADATSRIFEEAVRGVVEEQSRLMSGRTADSVSSPYLTVWGDQDIVEEYQSLLDQMLEGQAGFALPLGGSFIGKVGSIHEAIDEPYAEWYQ